MLFKKILFFFVVVLFSLCVVSSVPNDDGYPLTHESSTSNVSINYTNLQNYTANECPAGQYAYSRNQDGTWICRDDETGGSGTVTQIDTGDGLQGGTITTTGTISVNQSWFDLIYLKIADAFSGLFTDLDFSGTTGFDDFVDNDTIYNDTWINSTFFNKSEIIAFGYYNSSDFIITDYYTKADIDSFNYYNSSDFSISDYFTKSEVLAFNYYNSSDFNITDYINLTTLFGFNYYNSSDFDINDYYTKTQIDNFAYYNASDFDINDYTTLVQLDNSTIIREWNTSWITDNQNNYDDTWINNTFVNSTYTNNTYLKVDGTNNMEADLDIGDNNITRILSLQYNITACSAPEDLPAGSVCWNQDEDTLNIVRANGQIFQVGKEMGEDGINREGSMVNDGSIVYLSGASGDNPEFKKADGTDVSKSSMIGVLTTDCDNGELCPVTVFGFVNGLDTSSWSLGDKLYIDPSNTGQFTNITPSLPNNPIWVATVIRVSSTVGRIFVNPQIDPSDGFLINNIWATGNITANYFSGDASNLTNYPEPLSLHLNQDNWFNDSDGYIYWENQNTITFNQSKLATTYYNVSAIQVVAGTGSGTISNVQGYNGNSYNVTEDNGGTPGLDVRFNFTGVSGLNQILIRYKTDISENHLTKLQLYDYGDSSWENYGTGGEVDDWTIFTFIVADGDEHIQSGVVQLRVLSEDNGNSNHKHYFDWVTISDGFATPSQGEVDPIWNAEKNNYYNKTQVDNNLSNYILTSEESNLNVNSSIYSNETTWWASLTGWVEGWFYNSGNELQFNESKIVDSVGNWTLDKPDYYTSSQIDGFDYYNLSDFDISNYYLNSNPYGYYNITTAPVYINDTFAGNYSDYLTLFNWNKTYADTLYQPIGDYVDLATLFGFGYYNSSDFSISDYYTSAQIDSFGYYNASDFDISNYRTLTNNTFDGNLQVTSGTDTYIDINNTAYSTASFVRFYENSNNYGYVGFNGSTNDMYLFNKFSDDDADIIFGARNTERMRIKGNGNLSVDTNVLFVDADNNRVGIGTSAPAYELVVSDTSSASVLSIISNPSSTAQILFGDSDSDNRGRIAYDNSDNSMDFRTNGVERMVIDSSGYVGIGTSAPAYALDVNGVIRASGNLILSTNDISSLGNIYAIRNQGSASNANYAFSSDANTGMYSSGDDTINFATAGSEQMRISSAGYVGIGTTTPSAKLDVSGATTGYSTYAVFNNTQSSGNGAVTVQIKDIDNSLTLRQYGNSVSSGFLGGTAGIYSSSGKDLWLSAGDKVIVTSEQDYTNYDFVVNGGYVGLGAPSPSLRFVINGTSGADAGMQIIANNANGFAQMTFGGTGYIYNFNSGYSSNGPFIPNGMTLDSTGAGGLQLAATAGSGDVRFYAGGTSEIMRVDSNGNVGIGTASPAYKLDVNGSSLVNGITYIGDTSNYLELDGTLQLTADAAIQMNSVTQFQDAVQFAGGSTYKVTSTGDATFKNITSTGNVGIGTASPLSKLQVTGDEVRIGDAGTITYATGDGDLYVEDSLEVDGYANFVSGELQVSDGTINMGKGFNQTDTSQQSYALEGIDSSGYYHWAVRAGGSTFTCNTFCSTVFGNSCQGAWDISWNAGETTACSDSNSMNKICVCESP